jgi:diamine N-acetyltransferase
MGMDDEPIITMRAERVALGPLRHDLVPQTTRWINDLATARGLGPIRGPITHEAELAWFERAIADDAATHFTIYVRASRATGELVYDPPTSEDDYPEPTWLPIGTTALNDINWRNRTAEFGIMIGARSARGRGHGTETTRLMLDYAFTALGLHNVMLRVHEYNPAGAAAYRKAGFREFGRRREAQWMGGRFWDTIYMECLASEFTSPYLAPIFAPDLPR